MNIDEAVKQACEKPTLLEALTYICIWESERIVKQARTNEQWETCFKLCLKRVIEKYSKPKGGIMKFTIQCEMKGRWVPHFLAMLRYMEQLGKLGGSRRVAIYSDGDGDFRPKFKWNSALSSEAKPADDRRGDRLYDAG